jgi:hypothetical protein
MVLEGIILHLEEDLRMGIPGNERFQGCRMMKIEKGGGGLQSPVLNVYFLFIASKDSAKN